MWSSGAGVMRQYGGDMWSSGAGVMRQYYGAMWRRSYVEPEL